MSPSGTARSPRSRPAITCASSPTRGTTSELADRVTYDRLRDLDIEVGRTYGTLFDLFPDLSTPEGQLAEAIATGQDLAPAA